MSTLAPSVRKHVIAFFTIAAVASFIDILTKGLAFRHIRDYESYEVISDILYFQKTVNTGIVLGMFKNFSTFFLIVSVVAVPVIIVIFLAISRHRAIVTLSLGLILGGTFGNMYDRVMHDGVRDFIFIKAINWPVFNIADSAICLGVALLSITLIFTREERTERAEEAIAPAANAAPEPGPTPAAGPSGEPAPSGGEPPRES